MSAAMMQMLLSCGASQTLGTSDVTATGFTVSGATHSDAPTASNAFDNNPASAPATTGNTRVALLGGAGVAYIGQDFGAGNTKHVGQVTLIQGYPSGGGGYNITSVKVRYSDDGSAWFDAMTWSTSGTSDGGTREVSPSFDAGSHRYWQLLQNAATGGSGYWNVFEVEMFVWS